MKLALFTLLTFISLDSMAAIGCSPGYCHETPKPGPSCPAQPGGSTGRFPREKSLSVDVLGSNALKSTPTGISLDSNWKSAIYDFAVKNITHPSWGLSHSERNYQVTRILAEKEKAELDLDVLFAASFLHDLGGLKGYETAGVDHAVKSAELAEKLLSDAGFPMEKFAAVKEIILGHTYYTKVPGDKTAQLFRDADVLDFLGNIGIARILAVTSEDGIANGTLSPTVSMLQSFSKSMASKCISEACKEMAKVRQGELSQFLKVLNEQSFNGKAL